MKIINYLTLAVALGNFGLMQSVMAGTITTCEPVCSVESECVKSIENCDFKLTYLNSNTDVSYGYQYTLLQNKACVTSNGTVVRVQSIEINSIQPTTNTYGGSTYDKALAKARAACETSQANKIKLFGVCK